MIVIIAGVIIVILAVVVLYFVIGKNTGNEANDGRIESTSVKKTEFDDKGMKAENPSEVLVEMIKREVNEEDFMELCSSNLDKSKVVEALSAWESCGGYYSITVSGDNVYKEITGKSISLNKNEMSLGFYGGSSSDIWNISGRGCVILQYDEASEKYIITDIEFLPCSIPGSVLDEIIDIIFKIGGAGYEHN
jgi:hypothetical protein